MNENQKPKCASCIFAEPIFTDDDGQPLLKCFRYPPIVVAPPDGELTQTRPDAVDWCGEYQAQPLSITPIKSKRGIITGWNYGRKL